MPQTRKALRKQRKRRARFTQVSLLLTMGCALTFTTSFHALPLQQVAAPKEPPLPRVSAGEVQSLEIVAPTRVQEVTRDAYTSIAPEPTEEEIKQEVRVAEVAQRATSPQLALLEKLATTTLEPLHDPLDGTVGFPLADSWASNYEGNAFRTATRPDHKGSDYILAQGHDVLAVAEGDVTFAGFNGDYGYVVYLVSQVGGVTVETRYAHLVEQPPVQVGQQLKRGDVLGHIGNTGLSKGPHLHFEVKQAGVYVDPSAWLIANAA